MSPQLVNHYEVTDQQTQVTICLNGASDLLNMEATRVFQLPAKAVVLPAV